MSQFRVFENDGTQSAVLFRSLAGGIVQKSGHHA